MKIFIAVYGLFITFVLSTFFQKNRQQSIADGAEIYQDFCAQCHLDTGVGVPGAFPPLNKSDYLLNKNSSPLWWAIFILKLLKRCKFAEIKQAIQHVIIRFKCNLTIRWSIPIEN